MTDFWKKKYLVEEKQAKSNTYAGREVLIGVGGNQATFLICHLSYIYIFRIDGRIKIGYHQQIQRGIEDMCEGYCEHRPQPQPISSTFVRFTHIGFQASSTANRSIQIRDFQSNATVISSRSSIMLCSLFFCCSNERINMKKTLTTCLR